MYPPPTGPELSADECRSLDDSFFASDPTGYFRSRLDSLLDWCDATPETPPGQADTRRRFNDLIGAAAQARHPTTPEQRRRQAAVDAVQLRHAVAEALLRLILARLTCRASDTPKSLWLELTRTPTTLRDVVKQLNMHLEATDAVPLMAGLMVPAPGGTTLSEDYTTAVANALRWLQRASDIVSSGPIDLNAANNKIKHGITARAEDQLRATFMTAELDADGNVPLSALSGPGAVPLIDTIALDYISQPPKTPGAERPGHERTWLRADTPAVLAEAWMLALIHGAVVHTCAYRHNREQTPADAAPHPGLALGPSPDTILRGHVVGLRFPITTSASGQVHRPAGFLIARGADASFVALDHIGPRSTAVVVDDSE